MREQMRRPGSRSGRPRTRYGAGRPMVAALRHPFGVTLLVASLLLAVAVRFLPGLERWSALAPWVLLWGLATYATSVVGLHRSRPTPSEPELRELDSVRRLMKAKLDEREAANSESPTELVRVLAEAIRHVDKQIAPALTQLLERQGELSGLLERYEGGELPLPGPDILERLKGIHARQRAAIDECVQQASNAAGTLVALLQEGDDASVAEEARKWAKDLLNLYDAIGEVLRGEVEGEELGVLDSKAARDHHSSAERNVPSSNDFGTNGRSPDAFPRLVEEALRRLNNPSALSGCDLICSLPGTLSATRSQQGAGTISEPSPLDQAQALRELLVLTIERLKPPDGNGHLGDHGALQYHILYEEYVLKRPTRHIMTRHSISESTFHRNRRDAVAAVAGHLEAQEDGIQHGETS